MSEAKILLKKLCSLDAPSGRENAVRNFIISEIKDYCEFEIDPLGNIIAFKKGEKTPSKKLMIDAHMDEVGFIATHIDENGFIRFTTLGGIDEKVIVGRGVRFLNGTLGVFGIKPIHLCGGDEKKKSVKTDDLYIDIGAVDKEDAQKYVSVGDCAVFDSDLYDFGDGKLCGKAIDDRAGCAVLINMIKSDLPFDTYFTFSVQEEVGLRGARTATFSVAPDYAIVVESTTAADIEGVPDDKTVCKLGEGAAISFMDKSTIYDRELFDTAFEIAKENGIKCQAKTMVAGGNNSGEIHRSRSGVKTIAVSLPTRYLHSAVSVASESDFESVLKLVPLLAKRIQSL